MNREEIRKKYYSISDEQLLRFWNNNESYPLAKTFLHTHTDLGSPKDSVLTVKQYVARAKELGARSVSVTDHGTMYGVMPLYGACKENGLKLLVGCEFYVCDDDIKDRKLKHTRLHLVCYAKDKTGYKAISRLVTEGNKRIIQAGNLTYPCISKELLMEYVGEGSEGHGHVIGTSACIGGVVLGLTFASENDGANAEKLEKKIEDAERSCLAYTDTIKLVEELGRQKDELTALSKKTFSKKEGTINRMDEGPEKEKAFEELEKEKALTADAAKKLPALRVKLNALKKDATEFLGRMAAVSKIPKSTEDFLSVFDKWLEKEKSVLSELQGSLLDEEGFGRKFREELSWYDNLFGHGDWYAEIQFHGMLAEKTYMPQLAKAATELDIPLVAANDAHMVSAEYAEARNVVGTLRFMGTSTPCGSAWKPVRPEDEEMYLKDDCELYHAIRKVLPEESAFKAMKAREEIEEKCTLEFEDETHYPVFPVSA